MSEPEQPPQVPSAPDAPPASPAPDAPSAGVDTSAAEPVAAMAPDEPVFELSRSARFDADLRARGKYTELAALLAFLVPGLGHVYLGKAGRGLLAFVVLVGLFGWGIGISRGECVSLAADEESGHRYAFIAQVGAGLPTALALLHAHQFEVKKALGMDAVKPPEPDFGDPVYVERLPKLDEGLLYTMIAGLLNLLLIYDAFLGAPGNALRPPSEDLSSPPAPAPAAGAPPSPPKEPS